MKGDQGDGTYKVMDDDHKGVVNRGMEQKLETAEYASVMKGDPQSYSQLKASSGANLLAEDSQQESTGWSTKKKWTVALLVILVIILIVVIVILALYFTGNLVNKTETEYLVVYDPNPANVYNSSLTDTTSKYYNYLVNYYQTTTMADLANTNAAGFTVSNVAVLSFKPPPPSAVLSVFPVAPGVQVEMSMMVKSANHPDLPNEATLKSTITQALQSNSGWTTEYIDTNAPTTSTTTSVTSSAATSSSSRGSTASTNPTSGSTNPTSGSTNPTSGSTNPTSGSTNPTSGSTNPTSGSTNPTSGSTNPTSGSTNPSSGSTNPSSGSTNPTTGSTNPTSGSTNPTSGTTGTTTPHTPGTTTKHTEPTGTTSTTEPPITESICQSNQFQCGDGYCIPLSDKCSPGGKPLCSTGEDQKFCEYAHSCRPDEFQCEDDKSCIPGFWVCDGFKDCPNGTDETYCTNRCEGPNHFQCDNGECRNRMQVCNFIKDCQDGSDELSCDYSLSTFECDSGVNLPISVKCNGEFNCIDRTDERFCECNGPNDFQCANGYCITSDETFCNGIDNCGDNSDEPAGCDCQADQFKCTSKDRTCIPSYKQCDNEINCFDGSDEINCTCNANQFGCQNGLGPCIDKHLVCNGIPNCPDGSDEQQNCPPCSPYEFQCNGHVCIPYADYCDGIKECPDGDDEPSNCPEQPCPDGGYFCTADKKCISSPKVCNGFQDCSDGADEANCQSCAFKCSDGDRCLQASELCDGIAHCNDRADENCTCGHRVQRQHPEYFNDGYPDCRDFSDETDCAGGFHCPGSNDVCLSSLKVCDGVKDCPSGDDEAYCVFFQTEDMTNRTIYEWPFRFEGFVQVQQPYIQSGQPPYQQFEPDNYVLPLCVDSNMQFKLLEQVCAAGQGEPDVTAANYFSPSTAPSWLSNTDNYFLANAKAVTTLAGLYSGLRRQSAPCSGYFVNITCNQQSCPAPPKSSNEVGGKAADPYHWPYVVHIIRDGNYLCGGVLITNHHVLTAAHCIQDATENRLYVQGGWAHFTSSSPTSIQIPVLSTIIHPDFDPITRDSDLAIIHTEDFFNTTRFLRPFCPLKGIPPQSQLPNCFSLGWGKSFEDSPESDSLQQTILQPIKQYSCSMIPAFNNPKNIEITDHMMCAGSTDGTTGTCRGDDGGPLFCPYQNQLLLAGISSWRLGCDQPNVPSVFTFVPNFVEWINDNVYTAGLHLQGTTCEGLFRCFDGRCLPSTKLCDGVANCVQGEDESKALCTTQEHGEISCLWEFPSLCGYTRDFSFSDTTQWMFVDYGTAISPYLNIPIHTANYILFSGMDYREVQKGRLISETQGIGDPGLCIFVDYKIAGPNASFALHVCPASHGSSIINLSMCAPVNKTLPNSLGGWQRFTSAPLDQSYSYYTVLDAIFPAGANGYNYVAIQNISLTPCQPSVRCNSSDQFECESSEVCIPSEFYCDGRIDCPLGEDEFACALEPCFNSSTYKSFYCPSGVNHAVYAGSNRGGYYCIDASTVCDQEPDCNDAEDEHGCTCASTQLQCKNGRCMDRHYWCNQRNDCGDYSDEPIRCNCTDYLDQSQICDGVHDCGDGEDEDGCNKCSSTQFACTESGYTCIASTLVCDGIKDCNLGEDERTCVDTSVSKTTVPVATKEGLVKIKHAEPKNAAIYYNVCADSDQTVTAVATGACAAMYYPTVENASSQTTEAEKVFMYSPDPGGFLKSLTLEPFSSCTSKKIVSVVCSNMECGISQTNTLSASDIVGGQVAGLHAWPWSASLMTKPSGPFPKVPYFMCGATVIAKNWALTAAHCVSYISLADWTINVAAGTNRLSANFEYQQPLAGAILLRNATAHEVSDPNNDIALIYFKEPYNFDYSVWPACIPLNSPTFPPVGARCYTTGFGSTNANGFIVPVLSDDMKQAPTDVLNCTGNPNVNNNYNPDMDVCISGDGFCSGDSGSGLVCANGTSWAVGGTLSRFGLKGTATCGGANVPDLASRTSDYNYWITKMMYCFPDLELWPCQDGSGCIMWSSLCDGKQDCADNSDELECPSHGPCGDGFRCKNKECTRMSGWCDRISDCGRFPDGSDELPGCETSCPPLSLKCDEHRFFPSDRTCVSQDQICDGVYDCIDHTDETNCKCGDDEFKCKNELCINKNLYCNGYMDCSDGSDEPATCNCVRELPQSRICDGIVDCPYEEDESTCECGLQEFTCNKTIPVKCIPFEQHCNGKPECPGGEDEVGCFQYIEPNEYLGATVFGVPMKVCGDQWSDEAADKACAYQFFNKGYNSHVVPVTDGEQFKAYNYNPGNSREAFPNWFTITHNCSSNVVIQTQCGVPICGINTAFPNIFDGGLPDVQYKSFPSAQAPFPFVGALYLNNGFVCSGVLIATNLFALPASCFRNGGIQFTDALVDYTVRLGTSRLSAVADSEQFDIISYRYSPTNFYNPKNLQYDLIVVTLKQRAANNVLSTWPACLPANLLASHFTVIHKCYAVGWAPVRNDSKITYEVDQVVDEVAILPNKFCHDADPSRICVGHLNDDYSDGLMGHHNASGRPCMEEYSGTILCQRDDNIWYLVGFYQANSSCHDWTTTAVSIPFFYNFLDNLSKSGCANGMCRNGGTCVSDSIDHYCICEKGFSGQNCERINCDETLTRTSGSFHTPAIYEYNRTNPIYPNDADCRWNITVAPGKQVKLSFGNWQLAPRDLEGECTDYVDISQSWWHQEREFIGRFCGNIAPPDITSIANNIIVEFHSGSDAIHYDGFAASYQSADCVTRITNTSEGELTNPGYPFGYGTNTTCTWYITAPDQSQNLKFVINDITFPPGIPPCFLHYVKIFNGTTDDDADDVVTLCSTSSKQQTIVIDNFQAMVEFHSVSAVDFGGFNMSWYADKDNCLHQVCPRDSKCVDLVHNFTCQCPDGYKYVPPNCIKITPCLPNPCKNHAYCVTHGDSYECLCSPDWTGKNCQELQHAFYLSGSSGAVESPGYPANYPNNYVGFWFITVLSDQTINLYFIVFDVEPDVRCSLDNVMLYEGTETNPLQYVLDGPLCNSIPPKPSYTTTTNRMTVVFTTDETGTYLGFTARYTVVSNNPRMFSEAVGCGGTINPVGFGGTLASQFFPEPYPAGSKCIWTLTGDFSRSELTFRTVHLAHGERVCYDSVDIYDGDLIVPQKMLAKVCNETWVGVPIRSYSSIVTIVFTSGEVDSQQNSGFYLDYSQGSALCSNQPCRNGGICNDVADFIVCTCKPDFTGPFCESTTTCNVTLTAAHGSITSPNYPSDYNDATNCLWTIIAPAGYLIFLRFDAFAIEPSNGVATCVDFVRVYNDSANITRFPDEHSYCGFNVPGPYYSSANIMYVQMVTDETATWPGFSATYTMVVNYCKHADCNDHQECIPLQTGSTCKCLPGYTGKNCENEIDFCTSNPCVHNGTCIPEFNAFKCDCAPGYISENCSIDTFCGPVFDPCKHGATCEHGPTDAICHCTANWAGTHCQTPRCSNTFNEPNGVVESPDYPLFYPAGSDCIYTFFAPAGQVIKLYFDDFEVMNPVDDECVDYLALYNSQTVNASTEIARWCGVKQPGFTISTGGNFATMVFHTRTGGVGAGAGFSIRYFFGDDACQGVGCGSNKYAICENNFDLGFHCVCMPGYTGYPNCVSINYCVDAPCKNRGTCVNSNLGFQCICPNGITGIVCETEIDNCTPNPCQNNGQCTNVIGDYFCNCAPYFTGRNCETLTCPTQTLTGTTGVIQSPGYPIEYPANADCRWVVQTDVGKVIYLTVNTFDLEGPYPSCDYDYVNIYDGGDFTAAPTYTYCGKDDNTSPEQLPATQSNVMGILFHSDGDVQATGFDMSYASGFVGYCNSTIENDHGFLTSLGYPTPYQTDSYCIWTIVAPWEARIVLTFDVIDLDPASSCDDTYIDVYDYKYQVPWRNLGRLCSNITDKMFQRSFTNAMSFVFKTGPNAAGPHKGFHAYFVPEYISGCRAAAGNKCPDNGYCAYAPGGPRCLCYEGFEMVGDFCIPQFCNRVDCPNNTKCKDNFQSGAFCTPCGEGYSGRYCNYDDWCGISNPCKGPGGLCVHGETGPVCQCKAGYTGEFCENQLPAYRCGGEYVQFPGLMQNPVTSGVPFYPPNADCSWILLSPDPSSVVSIYFDQFRLQDSVDCTADSVKIYDTNGALLDTFCGEHGADNPIPIVTSNGKEMTVVFKSDDDQQSFGFVARYFLSPNYCSNNKCPANSYCQNTKTNYTCVCNAGYTGSDCSQKINYCASFPCQNKGTCVSDQTGYHCQCPAGYTGQNCESYINPCDPDPCMNGGFCITNYDSYTCGCVNGYYGPLCENPRCVYYLNDTSAVIQSPGYPDAYPDNLQCTWHIHAGHRQVIEFRFMKVDVEGPEHICNYDAVNLYDGPNAESKDLAMECGHSDAVLGPFFSTDFDMTVTFTTDATVTSQGFIAVYNFTHVSCINYPCPAHAACVTGPEGDPYCQCDYHFQGSSCEKIDDCAFVTCAHGGSCTDDEFGNFMCTCRPGFTGPFCEIIIDNCVSFPCQHGGTCIPDENTYTCECAYDWGGNNCDAPRNYTVISDYLFGIISTPNFPDHYPANAHFLWIIQAYSPYVAVTITFHDFFIEGLPGEGCNRDYLVVYDGDIRHKQGVIEISKLCGFDKPPPITSRQNAMSITFDSDKSIEMQGFLLMYNLTCAPGLTGVNCTQLAAQTYNICDQRSIYSPNGIVTSPNYPGQYPDSLRCPLTVDVRPYQRTPLQFTSFDINDMTATCDTDSLSLYDGHDENSKLLGKYCNGNKPTTAGIESTSDAITLVFVSGTPQPGASQGFQMVWAALRDVCVNATCGFGGCVAQGMSYTCKCDIGWTGDDCLTPTYDSYNICNKTGRQVIENGFLTSPNYPQNYLPNDDCTINLQTRPGFVFLYKFTDFQLQEPDQGTFCEDHVSIYDSNNEQPDRLVGSFCGSDLPVLQPGFTSSNYLTIEFKTDSYAQARGFNFTFSTIYDFCRGRYCPTNAYCINLEEQQGAECVCKDGWTNLPDCDIDINECLSSPCQNNGTCVNTPGSFFCECVPGYLGTLCEIDNYCSAGSCVHGGTCTHGPNGPVCICPPTYTGQFCENVDCGGILTDATGEIMSPNYPSHYPPLANCVWYITVATGSFVNLQFNYFQLEQSSACVADFLEIWFDSEMNEVPDKVLCGIGTFPDITSNINYMTLMFHTDKSIEFNGFDLTYTTVSKPGVKDSCSKSLCINGSKCVSDKSAIGFTCQCKTGFTGQYCETNVKN